MPSYRGQDNQALLYSRATRFCGYFKSPKVYLQQLGFCAAKQDDHITLQKKLDNMQNLFRDQLFFSARMNGEKKSHKIETERKKMLNKC